MAGFFLLGQPQAGPQGWRTLRVGAGGWITGIDIAADGAMVCRTDTYGAYLWNGTDWVQVVTTDALGSNGGHKVNGDLYAAFEHGVYEIVQAPSNSDIVYMQWDDFLFKSTNRCATFAKTTFAETVLQPNGNHRMNGPRMAVHPTDPNTIVAGTPDGGVFYSTNGGTSWTALSGVLNPTTSGPGFLVAFDPAPPNTVYVLSGGRGVYRSTTGVTGAFTLTSSGPTTGRRMAVGADGVLMVTDGTTNNNNLWRFQSGSWSNLSLTQGGQDFWQSITPGAAAGQWYVAADNGNELAYSSDNGANWTAEFSGTRVTGAGEPGWLSATLEVYMSNADIKRNPSDGLYYFAQGIGVWRATLPTTAVGFNWNARSRGIEQLVNNDIISPPTGSVIISFWDRCVFKITDPEVYPSDHGPDYLQGIRHGWSCDWASATPATIVVVFVDQNPGFAISTNGGTSWTVKAGPAGATTGGSVAASTSTNMVWVGAQDNARIKYTTNAGDSWTNATATGLPITGDTGFGLSNSAQRVCADRVTANKFYVVTNGTSASDAQAGIWVSTDSGANFTHVFTGYMPITSPGSLRDLNSFSVEIDAVPNNAGHLFYTAGDVGGQVLGNFLRSTDAGVTWSAVPNVVEVKAFGFGKEKPAGGGYPSIYIAGWVSGVYGIWRSDDGEQATPTWTQLEDFPLGRFDTITAVCGDNNTWGKCYVGFSGSGAVYYAP